MPKTRTKQKPGRSVPANLIEAAQLLSELRDAKRDVTVAMASAEAKINAIQAQLNHDAAPFQARIEELATALHAYATLHRDELTDGRKRQSIELATGLLGWRVTPPRVEIRKVEQVLEELKQRRLKVFIRAKLEPNREAMLADPHRAESIPGVSIVQDEFFYVRPHEFDTEIEVAKKRLRRPA